MAGYADKLREEGRADCVVILYVQLSRNIPALVVEDLCKMADVSPTQLGPAVQRLKKRRQPLPGPRRLEVSQDSIPCGRCGTPIPRIRRPGAPRTVCDDCAPWRRKERAG